MLITGITGFVGSHMVEDALAQGMEVFGSSRWRSKTENIGWLEGAQRVRSTRGGGNGSISEIPAKCRLFFFAERRKQMDARRWLALILVGGLLLAWVPPRMAQAEQSQQSTVSKEVAETPAAPGYVIGAAAINVIYIPGKAVLCTVAGAAGLVLLGVTFGSGYRTATRVVSEGCGGPWVITARDLKEVVQEEPGGMY